MIRKKLLIICSTAILVPIAASAQSQSNPKLIETLSNQNTCYTAPITQRTTWDSIAKLEKFQNIIEKADSMLREPFPLWNDSLIMQYPKTGNRVTPDRMMANRGATLMTYVYAEALQNQGRYLKAIERALNEICTQPTWVGVAHDRNLDNFWGREYHVDLNASNMADYLGQTLFLLEDKLDKLTTQRVRQQLDIRIYQPVLKSIRENDFLADKHYWFNVKNNWNLVCLAGVTNSALAVIKDKEVRAEFVEAAKKYIQNGLNGFMEDGYCVEGIGYYNYGFTFFLYLREGVYRASNGEIDLFDHPSMKKIATYGQRSLITEGVYPAISDCKLGSIPSTWIQWYCNKAYGWETKGLDTESESFYGNNRMLDILIAAFTHSPYLIKEDKSTQDEQNPLRSYFDKAGVITFRPQPKDQATDLAITIKGGHNGESHNHNDVSSYTIVSQGKVMMGDMGGPNYYTGDTFSNKRYSMPLFSAYGHPLAVFDDQMQFFSPQAKGVVTDHKFGVAKEEITYDISSCYRSEKLKEATRSFEYNRKKGGEVKVTDSYKASEPISYESVLTTRADVEVVEGGILLHSGESTIKVKILCDGEYSVSQEVIADPTHLAFTRVSIKMSEKSSRGDFTLIYSK